MPPTLTVPAISAPAGVLGSPSSPPTTGPRSGWGVLVSAERLDALARRYVRQCPHSLRDDLVQQARLALLEAADAADCGVRVARCAMRTAAWRDEFPTSCQRDLTKRRRLERVQRAVNRVPMPEIVTAETPESLVACERLRAAVRARLASHVLRDPHLRLALPVLLRGDQPARVAAAHRLPVSSIYRTVEDLRRRLRRDAILRQQWQEWAA